MTYQSKVKDMTFTALMAAVLCAAGPLSIPIGPVPIAIGNLLILLSLYVVGRKKGMAALLLYLLLGLIGLPVFAGFTGGPQVVLGPTGGYIVGYIAMALIAGPVIDRYCNNRLICVIGMVAATLVLYALGTAWLAYSAHMTFTAALAVGVLPFAAIDLAKICLCAIVGPVIRNRLTASGLMVY